MVRALQSKDIISVILNSGKNLNDFGNYDSCHLDEKMEYAVMRVQINLAFNVVIGLCLPKECGEDDWDLISAAMTELLHEKDLKEA